MQYIEPVFRPPSEAYSLIIQATIGCAYNRCRFCSLYKTKKFYIRPIADILADIDECAFAYGSRIEKVFLADGDALMMPTADMLTILAHIKKRMPGVRQISSYAAPRDLLNKTEDELKAIYDAGLTLLYIGAESGDDETLKQMCKGVTHDEIAAACLKAKAQGFRLSITLISGLGQVKGLKAHAVRSAELISKIKPEYLGFLTLVIAEPAPIVQDVKDGKFQLLSPVEVMEEMNLFLSHVDSEGTIFRSNHVSNYINLSGTLNRDIPALLMQVRKAKEILADS